MAEQKTYSQLRTELDELINILESGEPTDVDELLKTYQKATGLIKELEKRLTQAKNKLTKINKS